MEREWFPLSFATILLFTDPPLTPLNIKLCFSKRILQGLNFYPHFSHHNLPEIFKISNFLKTQIPCTSV
jgi:hypothetical protein